MSKKISLNSAHRFGGGPRLVVFLLGLPLLAAACATGQRPQLVDKPGGPVFYPPPPDPPRIQFLTSFSDSTFVQEKSGGLERFVLGEKDDDVQRMVKPYGVAMHGGSIFVCDTFMGIVHVFDMEARVYRRLGNRGQGRLQKPINISIGPDGSRYVSDIGRGQVVVFGPDNQFARAIGDRDSCSPTSSVVVDTDLFVVDIKDHEIERRNALSGALLDTFGGQGTQIGELSKPTNIAVGPDKRLYISDTINTRVQIFERDGTPVTAFGTLGDAPGAFARPKGLAVDPDGLIYVVDAAFSNVQLFDENGQLYTFFGGPGAGRGSMYLPAGITISRDGVKYFRSYVAPNFEPEYLIIVVSQYGTRQVGVYARGYARDAEYPELTETEETQEAADAAEPES